MRNPGKRHLPTLLLCFFALSSASHLETIAQAGRHTGFLYFYITEEQLPSPTPFPLDRAAWGQIRVGDSPEAVASTAASARIQARPFDSALVEIRNGPDNPSSWAGRPIRWRHGKIDAGLIEVPTAFVGDSVWVSISLCRGEDLLRSECCLESIPQLVELQPHFLANQDQLSVIDEFRTCESCDPGACLPKKTQIGQVEYSLGAKGLELSWARRSRLMATDDLRAPFQPVIAALNKEQFVTDMEAPLRFYRIHRRLQKEIVGYFDYHPEGLFDSFQDEWFSRVLTDMGEPSFLNRDGESTETYRILTLPSFFGPHSVRLERHPTGIFRKWTLLSPEFGPTPTSIAGQEFHEVTIEEWEQFQSAWEASRFWDLPTDDGVIGLDGERVVIEALVEGRHHVITRWGVRPSHSTRGLGALLRVVQQFTPNSTP